MHLFVGRGLFLSLLLTLLGCPESVDSEDIRTSGIHAELSATTPCSGTASVEAVLRLGANSNTYVDLSTGDKLMAWSGESSQRMTPVESELTEKVHYQAQFPARDADTLYRVGLERSAGEDAPNSEIAVAATQLALQAGSQSLSRRADNFAARWSGGSEATRVAVTVHGSCIETFNQVLDDDTGILSFPAGTLMSAGSSEDAGPPGDATTQPVEESCRLSLVLERRYLGLLDPAYGEGGSFTARQQCSVEFDSTP